MSNLDDFFAKRDKKKSKTKKFITSDEIVKQLESCTKEGETKEKNTNLDEVADGTQKKNEEYDEEWKTFEEEKKDYTGLKLGQLAIDGDDQGDGMNENDEDYDPSLNDGENSAENPWNKASAEKASTQEQAATKPTKSTVYASPAVLRGEMNQRRKGVAPDLKNESYFPSLGTDRPSDLKPKKNDFEEVKHGGKLKAADNITASVRLGNRFTTLTSNELDS